MVCKKIANIYKKDSKDKLAGNFLRQALKLAESIGNQIMIQSFQKEFEEISDSQLNQKRILNSIYKISDIFRNIQDYNKSLQKVVEFAVDQTGAERGVLLLKKEDSSELKVKAFINCDEESLKDVRDFSTTIPMEVSKVLKPVIIDNALEDKRTKKYKSIILHNIRSVICLPISLNNTLLGALYLDHHTIPALFDDDDITFVSSIANFIAVMLVTIQKYRNINIINQQLIEEMNQLGEHQSFITKDATMGELFNKLPEVARTNAPILILGESGTGKEIICQMIHNLSFRSKKPLLKLNCAAIATPLIESELFGIAKNVATNVQEREGKFSAADGGTLFIDEIGDMPLDHTDIRFIYATNKDLIKLMKEEKFRQDLYYRINTITIEIPPLRERRDDITLLLEHFLKLFSKGFT